VKDYTYLGTILTNENELKPEIEIELRMQIEHIMHFTLSKESINTQSRKNQNLQDINMTSGNIRSRILDVEY
jgi:hypothetical protein